MPDITITITTQNIDDKEREHLYRDIATLTARFVRLSSSLQQSNILIEKPLYIENTPTESYVPDVHIPPHLRKEHPTSKVYYEHITPLEQKHRPRSLSFRPPRITEDTNFTEDTEKTYASERLTEIMHIISNKFSDRSLLRVFRESRESREISNSEHNPRKPRKPRYKQHTQLTQLPDNLFDATYNAIIQIPIQARAALQQLSRDTATQLADIHNSQVLSAQQKADQIQQIEQRAANRRIQIEHQANRAKIQSFQKVVQNFITGIGRMLAEQLKLRTATAITNAVFGTQTPGAAGGSFPSLAGGKGVIPHLIREAGGFSFPHLTREAGGLHPISRIISTFTPVLAAANPALAIGSGLALSAAKLFASSFDDPINDALARQAGINQAQHRATELGRRSAVDLTKHFVHGFTTETEQQTDTDTAPVVRNEIKLIIGTQELKAIYEETQRQIKTGTITQT